MRKYIYLNIGLSNMPVIRRPGINKYYIYEGTPRHRDIMDSIAYAFDNKPFIWAHTWSTYEGQDEPTLVLTFGCDPIPDSTIIKKLEALCTTYSQDSIAYEIAQDNETGELIEPYLQGLAWHPRVRDGHSKYLFNPDYFKKLSDCESKGQLYTSENIPMGSKYKAQEIINKSLNLV